ncbi:hypothetical protein P355_3708 [Burkholderia cenocepacia KC-01]|nr:hypothetical protein P355_3708 [Burkholderia cenocepacia KC-01]
MTMKRGRTTIDTCPIVVSACNEATPGRQPPKIATAAPAKQ